MIYKEMKFKEYRGIHQLEKGNILQRKSDNLFYEIDQCAELSTDTPMYVFFKGFLIKRTALHLHFCTAANGSFLVYEEGN